MSSDEEKASAPALPGDSDPDNSVSSDLQTEYEELLRYAVVTPKSDAITSKQSYPKSLGGTDDRILSAVTEEPHTSGKGPAGREHRNEPERIIEINNPSTSKAEVLPSLSPPKRITHPIMDFFSSNHLNDSFSPGTSSPREKEFYDRYFSESYVTDDSLQKIENMIDLWSSGLKTNVLAELSKWKLNFIDWHGAEMKKEKDKHAAQMRRMQNQVDDLTELQKTYETSAGRKDEVIATLTEATSKQKERIDLLKTFFRWRIEHLKAKQEVYEAKFADQHYHKTLKKKIWKAWRSTVKSQWKDAFEKACQSRAEEICLQISHDYEAQIVALNATLEASRTEIQKLQCEKEQFEESMKKAFMRGVCALNLEAMSIFQGRSDSGIESTNKKDDYGPSGSGKDGSVPFDPSLLSVPTPAPAQASTEEMFGPKVVTSVQQKAGRTITARIAGRSDLPIKTSRNCGNLSVMGVLPPMSSVVIEKHHPVTQQTIPQALAAKYPRTIHHETSGTSSRHTGPGGKTSALASHSIKVVD
ncbi:centrosomal protein POC5 isoform X2 [Trichosurus vulpecula]|uniref:centrosomal protein POC5 isoform X2 n=1 Tax=Trichosurus vulpecula TaxID=9337 RepID=UPI00186B4217|nr:centrosomal protein POC5 isoform X2 [Trichosurus vulpecula]XP_036612514.1 centrosomal protein POC5 isoform X2 [Trichosurus vulpecula]